MLSVPALLFMQIIIGITATIMNKSSEHRISNIEYRILRYLLLWPWEKIRKVFLATLFSRTRKRLHRGRGEERRHDARRGECDAMMMMLMMMMS
jgi:hypothetical protein